MIYVYALTEPPCVPSPDVKGLEGRPVEVAVVEEVAAVYSRHDGGAAARPEVENLWAHERVVESCMAGSRGALLPIRFGTIFADEQKLAEVITRHAGMLRAGFDRVRDCVELGVRIIEARATEPEEPPAEPTPAAPPTTGREYMMARLAAERRRRGDEARAARVVREVHEALFRMARDAVEHVRTGSELLVTCAYLVPRGTEAAFARRVRELAAERPTLRLLCTGPWPAYHFTPSLTVAEPTHG